MDPKILGVVGGIGTLGAGGIYLAVANPFKTEEKTLTISELIKNEAFFKPLIKDSKDEKKWNEAWERYRNAHKVSSTGSVSYEEKDIWELSVWKTKKNENVAFEEFKNKCEEKSKAKVSLSSQEYKDFKNYCARPKTVAELIGEDTKTILLSKTDSGDSNHWNTAWGKYKSSHLKKESSSEYETNDTWKITGWTNDKDGTTTINNYKTKCEEQAGKDIDTTKEFKDENFINVKSWCTRLVS